VHGEHSEGSLWDAFEQGRRTNETALAEAREKLRRVGEGLERDTAEDECAYEGGRDRCPGSPELAPCRWHAALAALALAAAQDPSPEKPDQEG